MNKQAKIIVFSCLYMFGIYSFFSEYFLPVSIGIFIILGYLYKFKNLISTKLFCTYAFIFLLGFFNASFNSHTDDELTTYANENVNITAKVLTIPTNNQEYRTKFYAKVLTISTKDEINKNITAKTLVTINDERKDLREIKIGDTIKHEGKLKLPNIAQNPSQFDYARYLQLKKTFSLLYVNENWKIQNRANDFLGKLIRKLNDTRNNIIKIHSQNIKSPMLEILGGIIFGDDAVNPDENTKEKFINSGIFHILSASGMNVTLIFGIWYFIARSLRLNYKFSIISGILLILFYTCMTGFGTPIIRATIMLTLILIGKLIDKATSTISLLFIVAFLMLLTNPLTIFDIGFQLSFITTFALIITAPLLAFSFKHKFINITLGACLIPFIAQLYAAPLQMYYFNTFSVYAVLANIAIVPVLSIVSFIGFISSIIAMIPAVAKQICYFADLILNPILIYIVKVAELFSTLPHSIIYVKKPSLIQIILYFTIIVSITCLLKFKIKSKKIIISITTLLIIFTLTFITIPNKNAEVIFFSLGNADAVLLKSPNNEYFLIDTGRSGYLKSSSQAKNIIIKYIRDKGIKDINSLILTHFDSDHAGGTVDILENIYVKKLYITETYENTMLSDNIKEYLDSNKINYEIAENIEEIYNKDNFILTIIEPVGELIKSENQKSLIVHCKYKDKNLLFMADGDIKTYESIPDIYKNNISIIKSGHHGAKNTINNEMINNSDLFILSTSGYFYNHPHPQTIRILEENNKKYLRTDYHNAIKLVLNNSNYRIYMYSPKTRKFIEKSN